jgi:cyanate permease
MSSLAMQAGGAVAGPLLGVLAAHTSIATAMVVAGVVSTLGVVCFLPAWRRSRRVDVEDTTAVPSQA